MSTVRCTSTLYQYAGLVHFFCNDLLVLYVSALSNVIVNKVLYSYRTVVGQQSTVSYCTVAVRVLCCVQVPAVLTVVAG